MDTDLIVFESADNILDCIFLRSTVCDISRIRKMKQNEIENKDVHCPLSIFVLCYDVEATTASGAI